LYSTYISQTVESQSPCILDLGAFDLIYGNTSLLSSISSPRVPHSINPRVPHSIDLARKLVKSP